MHHLVKTSFAAIALSIAGLASAATPAARDWTVVDLGSLGGGMSNARAVSDAGHVVGCAAIPSGVTHAFLWKDGVMRDLDPGGTAHSCAYAVNNGGVAAGMIGEDVVVWNANGTVTRLGVQGWVGGINDAGVVAGTYKFGASVRAFMWNRGAIVNLGTLGGSDSDPYNRSEGTAINSRNQVVGASNGRAFLYENGAMRDIGSGRANAINDRGEVVGMTSNHGPVPFIYTSVMTFLPGPGYSSAVAINGRGQVLGSGEGIHGYLLEGDGYRRLDALPGVAAAGWRRLDAAGINSRGWMVGSGVGPRADPSAFLLVPGSRAMTFARERR